LKQTKIHNKIQLEEKGVIGPFPNFIYQAQIQLLFAWTGIWLKLLLQFWTFSPFFTPVS